MDDRGPIQPAPSGNQPPQGQEVILNLNHGVMPAMPPANPGSVVPPTSPAPVPSGFAQPMQQSYPPTMPGQPGAPWQGSPLPQAPYPNGMMPPTTPANGMPAQPPDPNNHDGHGKKTFFILALAIITILLIGGSVAAVVLGSKKPTKSNTNNTANQSCADPTTGSSVSKQNAEITYVRVALAIKQKNQTCVTSLSSTYFVQLQTMTYPNSNGQWVTKSEDNLPSLADRLANVSSSFTVSQFTSSDYTRAATTGSTGTSVSSNTNLPQGITLSYPITDAYTKAKAYLQISFISANDKVAVDYLKLVPASASASTSSNTSPQGPAAPDAGAVAADQELAQQDVISINSYLSTYRSNTNSYPSTIDAATFIGAGIGVDTNVFSPPAGTSFVYAPGPSGCTTAAKNCVSFTLTAMDTSNNTVIYGTSGNTHSN